MFCNFILCDFNTASVLLFICCRYSFTSKIIYEFVIYHFLPTIFNVNRIYIMCLELLSVFSDWDYLFPTVSSGLDSLFPSDAESGSNFRNVVYIKYASYNGQCPTSHSYNELIIATHV